MAEKDERLVGITPAMREGSGMVEFDRRFPKRYFDVGIAEQHAVTFAAGLACEGMKPVVAIYSTFLQRAYDQLIHDVAIQNLPVVFALDRGGLVGADGATHAGSFDIAYLRCIPNVSVLTPADENECRQALYTAFLQDHPVAVRYPRGAGAGIAVQAEMTEIPFGTGEIRREVSRATPHGKRIAILAFGTLLYPSLAAAERIDATVANMRFAKPLDVALVTDLARRHDAIVTVEEGTILGGAGSAVLEALAEARIDIPVLTLGLPDSFVEHGDPAKLLAQCGLDAAGIEHRLLVPLVELPACRLSIVLWYGPKTVPCPRRDRGTPARQSMAQSDLVVLAKVSQYARLLGLDELALEGVVSSGVVELDDVERLLRPLGTSVETTSTCGYHSTIVAG
jgi:1-deoxy-D-xylulose-5-phosphate synthase